MHTESDIGTARTQWTNQTPAESGLLSLVDLEARVGTGVTTRWSDSNERTLCPIARSHSLETKKVPECPRRLATTGASPSARRGSLNYTRTIDGVWRENEVWCRTEDKGRHLRWVETNIHYPIGTDDSSLLKDIEARVPPRRTIKKGREGCG